MNAIDNIAGLAPGSRQPNLPPTSTQTTSPADEDMADPPIQRTLRRSGRKAVRFEGWHVVEAVGSDKHCRMWHDLNLYRTVTGSTVVELVARRHPDDGKDLFRVKTFADLEGAATWLESYDCAEDVSVPAGLCAADAALPRAILQSVQLRQQLDRVEANYRALLSDVFAALGLTDPAEALPVTNSGPAHT